MDSPVSPALLAEVTCSWSGDDETVAQRFAAAVIHRSAALLILEAIDPRQVMPPLGALVHVTDDLGTAETRMAEHGRGGRFLLSVGERPVRQALRVRVSVEARLRSPLLRDTVKVEIVDLTTSGARIRGLELPVGSQVTVEFTPPAREQPVSVRAIVAHGTHNADQPWIGVLFRLVALRGGR
jgi:hypothetical protein